MRSVFQIIQWSGLVACQPVMTLNERLEVCIGKPGDSQKQRTKEGLSRFTTDHSRILRSGGHSKLESLKPLVTPELIECPRGALEFPGAGYILPLVFLYATFMSWETRYIGVLKDIAHARSTFRQNPEHVHKQTTSAGIEWQGK